MEYIAPSNLKSDPWAGGMAHATTRPQQIKLAAMAGAAFAARDRFKLPETFLVQRGTEPKIGDNGMPGFVMILCPVIGARKDRTKLRVIAPNGSDQWVPWNGKK